jgi:mRNA interferase RelE/StbE
LYRVEYERRAERELLSLPREVARRIALAIDELATDPRQRGVHKIAGARDLFRLRLGRYRVVCHVSGSRRLVVILRVAKRAEATYRGP